MFLCVDGVIMLDELEKKHTIPEKVDKLGVRVATYPMLFILSFR